MVDKYRERGEMFVLNDDGVKAECLVAKEADGIYEIKNIAVRPDLLWEWFFRYADCKVMLVGTGDSLNTLNFYQKCGFAESHRILNFLLIIMTSRYMKMENGLLI